MLFFTFPAIISIITITAKFFVFSVPSQICVVRGLSHMGLVQAIRSKICVVRGHFPYRTGSGSPFRNMCSSWLVSMSNSSCLRPWDYVLCVCRCFMFLSSFSRILGFNMVENDVIGSGIFYLICGIDHSSI